MSVFPTSNPNTGVFRDYAPGPHSGVETDPEAHVAPGSLDSRARNALILGVLSLVLGIVTGIPALWFGRKALRHLEAGEGGVRGRWAAWTGIALGGLGVALTVAVWVVLHRRS